MTCIALRRRVEGETERQMRASGRFGVSMPRRIAVVLGAAIEAVRKLSGCVLPAGKCLTILAKHFLDVWKPLVKKPGRDLWLPPPARSALRIQPRTQLLGVTSGVEPSPGRRPRVAMLTS